ncbi:MAG: CoA transferase [Myxococcota bacterium]|nr:CoA transferase [Myxococcota bacterium]
MTQILQGIRVLEVAQWWFVPSAGAALRDWGAEIIKVEHPEVGDPQRGLMTSGMVAGGTGVNFMMEQPNRGKKSVAINLKSPDGIELLYKLAETCDVFLTSFLPDLRQRLEIDVEHIRARNPNIIYVRGTGQGARGPEINKAGYDGTSYWCRSGMAYAMTRRDAEIPAGPRPAFGDGVGGLTIAGGIAGALFHRERTGEATTVDVSLLATAMWQLAPDIAMSPAADTMLSGGRGAPANPLVNNYQTGDGRWLQLIMLQADRDWPDFCEHIDRADLIEDPRFASMALRRENTADCVRVLEEVFAKRPLAEWRERFETLRGAWTAVQTPREVHDDPQVVANDFLGEVAAADGSSFKLVSNPIQYDEEPYSLEPAPEHGQNTEEVLLDLGLSWDQIAAHRESRAIG